MRKANRVTTMTSNHGFVICRFAAKTKDDVPQQKWRDALTKPRYANWFVLATGPRDFEGYVRTTWRCQSSAFWSRLQADLGVNFATKQESASRMDATGHFVELAARTGVLWKMHSHTLPKSKGGYEHPSVLAAAGVQTTDLPATSDQGPSSTAAHSATRSRKRAASRGPEEEKVSGQAKRILHAVLSASEASDEGMKAPSGTVSIAAEQPLPAVLGRAEKPQYEVTITIRGPASLLRDIVLQ